MSNKITITQGNTLDATITINKASGGVANLTGATIVVTVKNGNVTIETTTITSHTTPLSGISSFGFTKLQTALWPNTLLTYEVDVTLSNTKKFTALQDYIEVKKDV